MVGAQLGDTQQIIGERRAKPLVLVVEDDAAIARLLERYLVRAQFDVVIAPSGADALELARRRHPDVITLDLVLPGLSGHDVLNTLRQDEHTRDIPVVIISIHGDETGVEAVPVFARLTKPLDRQLLIRTISEACAQPCIY